MTAVVHFVVFADDGVISSLPSPLLPKPAPDLKNAPKMVVGASGKQRFACGVEASKLWARTDTNGILHNATGEAWLVSCETCKQTQEWKHANDPNAGTIAPPEVVAPVAPPISAPPVPVPAPVEGADDHAGAAGVVAGAGKVDTAPANGSGQ
jgi:hypothetical protein